MGERISKKKTELKPEIVDAFADAYLAWQQGPFAHSYTRGLRKILSRLEKEGLRVDEVEKRR